MVEVRVFQFPFNSTYSFANVTLTCTVGITQVIGDSRRRMCTLAYRDQLRRLSLPE